ncbi:helix-turn-helix transcriptional regulator [Micromonospora sp. NPDC007271]|uniref:helix-turn-helix domain-containing protein n=1 Tax=Micromonospora sp. NPDC007271 TaxID=3154587 RepID=UPI0033C0E6E1
MADSHEIKAARRDLGRRLAQLRKAAGHTQHSFARLVQYGRSSVANTETGHQYLDRAFWTRSDTILQERRAQRRLRPRLLVSSGWPPGLRASNQKIYAGTARHP